MHSFSSNFQHDFTVYFATHLAHSLWPTPQKRNIFPKHFLYLRPISQMGKKFRTRLKEPIIWHTLSGPSKKNYTEKFIMLSQKNHFFKQNNFSHSPLKKSILQPTKVSYNYQKKQFFQTKNFLSLREKVKVFYFKCVLSTALLFFIC